MARKMWLNRLYPTVKMWRQNPLRPGLFRFSLSGVLWMAIFSGRPPMILFMSLAYVLPSSKVTGW